MTSILIAEPECFTEAARAILESVGRVHLLDCDRDALARGFVEHDVVWVRLRNKVDEAVIGRAPKCRVIASGTTGLDHIDLEVAADRGIRVVSLKGESEFLERIRATAELAVGLTLALIRHIPRAAAAAANGVWNRDLFEGRQLFEKTAGIVGVGRLGKITAGYFQALGMDVVGFDPRADFPAGVRRADSLEALLRESDVVSLHASLEPSTVGLIGSAELSLMKRTAVLVNTARGGLIDEESLLAALRSGDIAGAALDVLASEPDVSAEDPLLAYARNHDNLLVVPHIGGRTRESLEDTEVFMAEKVVAALKELT